MIARGAHVPPDVPDRARLRFGMNKVARAVSALTSSAPATIRPMPHRVLRSAAREFCDVLRAATTTHRRLRDQLVTIMVATVGIDLVCAIAAFLLERHAQQTEVKTFGSAAFWTTTQLLTVSSQLKNPVSAGGRVLDVFMEI